MQKKWLFRDAPDSTLVEALKNEMGIEEVVAYLLVQRGITEREAAISFFRGTLKELHDPFTMKDMDKAVNRVNLALANNEKILVYGDYDVDGTTAVAMMYSFLSEYTSSIDYYIPDRYAEGYGVSAKGIQTAIEEGYSLIITLDCGIKAIEQIGIAKSAGVDVIVCDHHTPGDVLPDAIVLDPKRKDCSYSFKELSGCGVGFKLLQALTQHNDWEMDNLFDYLDLLAISIGADIVPVNGENRLLTQYGLKKLNRDTRAGLEIMLKLAKREKPLSLTDVVFTIAPRINAAGRIDDAKEAVRLLISENDEEVRGTAIAIHEQNEERKNLDKIITQEALSIIENDDSFQDKCTTIVYQPTWHKGVIGIVASRLIENYYRPTIVFTQAEDGDTWTGSARSIKDVNIYEVLVKCSHLLERFGGHNYAAGLSIKDENLEEFINSFESEVRQIINPESLIPEQIIEKELPFNQLFTLGESVLEVPRLMRVLKEFEPHGPANMKPLFLARNVFAYDAKLLKGEHLKMKVFQPDFKRYIDAIYFSSPEALAIVEQGGFDMVFTLDENQFRGRTTPQIMVKDIRTHNPTETI